MNKTKPCLHCGKTITKPQNESLKNWINRHKYCSRICLGKHRAETSVIGKPFTRERHYVPPTAIKKGQHLSPKTQFKKGLVPWNKNRSWTPEERAKIAASLPKRFGEDAGNWKGGTTKLGQLIRSNKKYYEWMRACLNRDNYTCRFCARKRKKGDRVILEVDHIKPFALIVRDNNIKTIFDALECQELWNIKNGRTLCRECHYKTETYSHGTVRLLKSSD